MWDIVLIIFPKCKCGMSSPLKSFTDCLIPWIKPKFHRMSSKCLKIWPLPVLTTLFPISHYPPFTLASNVLPKEPLHAVPRGCRALAPLWAPEPPPHSPGGWHPSAPTLHRPLLLHSSHFDILLFFMCVPPPFDQKLLEGRNNVLFIFQTHNGYFQKILFRALMNQQNKSRVHPWVSS